MSPTPRARSTRVPAGRRSLRVLARAGVIALAAACGGGDGATTPDPSVLTTLSLAATAAPLPVGQTVTLTLTARDQNGASMSPGSVAWSSSAGAVATVDASGVVRGVSPGTAEIVATAEGKQGRATVTVIPAPVAAVALSSATLSLARGTTHQLTATTTDAAGTVLTGRAVTWASSAEATATVSATGLVTAVGTGSATITATSEGRSATTTVTVAVAPIADVERTSSYAIAQANALAMLIDWQQTPDAGKMQTARAVADLDGDGVADAVVAPGVFLAQTANDPMRFYKGASAGGGRITLTDRTSAWVSGSVPSILHARKVILGDYNADGVKDVYTCAHGYDAPPFPGTTNALLLSGGGRWSVSTQAWSGTVGFSHGCASGDVDNDGDVDVLVLDSKDRSYFLLNGGGGAFTLSRAGLPAALAKQTPVFSTEMLDLDGDGYLDLLTAGDEQYHASRIFWGDGSGTFADARMTTIPAVSGWGNVLVFSAGDVDGDGRRELAVTRTKGAAGDPDFYKGFLVQVLSVAGRVVTDVTGSHATATNASAAGVIRDYQGSPTWVEWLWLADHDGDGDLDLVASGEYAGRFRALNTGGSFGAWTALP